MANFYLFMALLIAAGYTKIKMVLKKNGKELVAKINDWVNSNFGSDYMTAGKYNHYVLMPKFDLWYFLKNVFWNFENTGRHVIEVVKNVLPFLKNVAVVGLINFILFSSKLVLAPMKWISFLFALSTYELAIFMIVVSVYKVWHYRKVVIYSADNILFDNVAMAIKSIIVLIISTWIFLPGLLKIGVKLIIGFAILWAVKKFMKFWSNKFYKKIVAA